MSCVSHKRPRCAATSSQHLCQVVQLCRVVYICAMCCMHALCCVCGVQLCCVYIRAVLCAHSCRMLFAQLSCMCVYILLCVVCTPVPRYVVCTSVCVCCLYCYLHVRISCCVKDKVVCVCTSVLHVCCVHICAVCVKRAISVLCAVFMYFDAHLWLLDAWPPASGRLTPSVYLRSVFGVCTCPRGLGEMPLLWDGHSGKAVEDSQQPRCSRFNTQVYVV